MKGKYYKRSLKITKSLLFIIFKSKQLKSFHYGMSTRMSMLKKFWDRPFPVMQSPALDDQRSYTTKTTFTTANDKKDELKCKKARDLLSDDGWATWYDCVLSTHLQKQAWSAIKQVLQKIYSVIDKTTFSKSRTIHNNYFTFVRFKLLLSIMLKENTTIM